MKKRSFPWGNLRRKRMSNLAVPFPVFCVLWYNESQFFVCGGGEKTEIPKRICLIDKNNFKVLMEFETKVALLKCDVNEKMGLFVGCGMRNMYLFKMIKNGNNNNMKFEEVHHEKIFAKEYPNAETKLCCFTKKKGEFLCITDDKPSVIIYSLKFKKKEEELDVKQYVRIHNPSQITCLSIVYDEEEEEEGDLLCLGDINSTCVIYSIKNKRILKIVKSKDTISRKVVFSHLNLLRNELLLVQTARMGPTMMVIHKNILGGKKKDGGRFNIRPKKYRIHKRGCTSISQKIVDRYFISLSCQGEMLVLYNISSRNIERRKRIKGSMAITCCDTVKSSSSKRSYDVVNGSILNSLNLTKFRTSSMMGKFTRIFLFWMILGFFFAMFLDYYERR